MSTAATEAPPAQATKSPWLLSAPLDLLLVANLAWPILATLGALSWTAGPISFVQLYVISSAHRWITVPLVLFDRRFIPTQSRRFGLVLLGTTVLTTVGVAAAVAFPHPLAPDNLLIYLMMIDYVWNAWHFASQHAGIYRIYGRRCGAVDFKEAEREKAIIRVMALWVLLRAATVLGSAGESIRPIFDAIGWLDPLFFIGPLWLWGKELRTFGASNLPRLAYLGSVVTLYAVVLVVLRLPADAPWRGGVLLAHALFHAMEYLAVCSWAIRGKRGGVWDSVAPRVGISVLAFCLGIGVMNWVVMNVGSLFAWGLLTLWVSYLHYAWDGMIWKAPAKAAPVPG